MQDFPRFSVIIPNYNNAATLERALQSVLQQTYSPYEIIVVDDGSTDESREIIQSYENQVCCIFQPNAGVSAARNLGASIATGDWLAFLDADDVYLPDRLLAHAEWIKDEPDIDFLLAEQESRTPDGKLLNLFMKSSKSGKALLAANPNSDRIFIHDTEFEDLVGDGFGEIRTLSVPRERFLALGGFPVDHKIGEDLHFFIRLYAASSKGGVVPRVLAIYYIYENSALRRDAVAAMELFYKTLASLEKVVNDAPISIRNGLKAKRRQARLSLAYAYLKADRKIDAILSVSWPVFKNPGISSIRDFFSICRGFPAETRKKSFDGIEKSAASELKVP